MFFTSTVLAIAVGLFLGMVLLLEIGRRIGIKRLQQDPEGARAGIGAVEGSVFGLLGLLIAFTFSGAASRFDVRRQLIVEETNAIGTAYLRIDMLPADAQPAVRELFRQYLDTRIEAYRKLPNIQAAKEELAKAAETQNAIWKQAVAACRTSSSPQAAMLVLPSLNQMIDITTMRSMATQMHPPMIVFVMLGIMALAGALIAGYGMASGRSRNWLHVLCFAAIMAITVYVIIDIEYPRVGLITVEAFDQAMIDLRAGIK